MELEVLKKLENIDLGKVEKKIWIGISSIFGAYLFISLVNKFIADNYSFRIQRISNLPPIAPKPQVTCGATNSSNQPQ